MTKLQQLILMKGKEDVGCVCVCVCVCVCMYACVSSLQGLYIYMVTQKEESGEIHTRKLWSFIQALHPGGERERESVCVCVRARVHACMLALTCTRFLINRND